MDAVSDAGHMENGKAHHDSCCISSESQIIVKCKTGGNVDIPIANITSRQPIPIVAVDIDTRGLYNPAVKINFSSIISYSSINDPPNGHATFQLSRIHNNGIKIPLKAKNFLMFNLFSGVVISDSFDFIFCEENTFPGVSTYIVEVTASFNLVSDSAFFVSNASISALAVGTPVFSEFNCYSGQKSLASAILKRGNSINRTVPLFNSNMGFPLANENLPLASVTIDVTHLNPVNIEVEFSAEFDSLSFPSFPLEANILLSKVYLDKHIIPLRQFVFRREAAGFMETMSSFSFVYCENNQYPGCYTYMVELTSIDTMPAGAQLSITGTDLTAFAVGYTE